MISFKITLDRRMYQSNILSNILPKYGSRKGPRLVLGFLVRIILSLPLIHGNVSVSDDMTTLLFKYKSTGLTTA